MKLMYCPTCADAVAMRSERERSCECGACRGQYLGTTKLVVSGPDVQVIGIRNDKFSAVLGRALDAQPGAPANDYHLPKNNFPAWVYGPNALAVTKATTQTPRDVRELAGEKASRHQAQVDRWVSYLRRMPNGAGAAFLADITEEFQRLAPLGQLVGEDV